MNVPAKASPLDLSAFDMSALIREANSNHRNVESVADEFATLKSSALGYALCAGAALAEVKSRLNHGEWLPWLDQNFAGGARTAQKYLRLYDNQAELPNASQSTHFGINETLKLLSTPKTKPQPKPKHDPDPDDAPEEVVERNPAPASAAQDVGAPNINALLKYVTTIHKLWPSGKSYRFLIVAMRQEIERLEALEAQNAGGEQ